MINGREAAPENKAKKIWDLALHIARNRQSRNFGSASCNLCDYVPEDSNEAERNRQKAMTSTKTAHQLPITNTNGISVLCFYNR